MAQPLRRGSLWSRAVRRDARLWAMDGMGCMWALVALSAPPFLVAGTAHLFERPRRYRPESSDPAQRFPTSPVEDDDSTMPCCSGGLGCAVRVRGVLSPGVVCCPFAFPLFKVSASSECVLVLQACFQQTVVSLVRSDAMRCAAEKVSKFPPLGMETWKLFSRGYKEAPGLLPGASWWRCMGGGISLRQTHFWPVIALRVSKSAP